MEVVNQPKVRRQFVYADAGFCCLLVIFYSLIKDHMRQLDSYGCEVGLKKLLLGIVALL